MHDIMNNPDFKHNVKLRRLNEEDAMTSWKWRNDPEVFRYTARRPDITVTPEIEREWIRKVLSDPTTFRCAILADDIYCGNIFLTDIDKDLHIAQIHIFIGLREITGQGVGTMAFLLLLDHAFKNLDITGVYCTIHIENTAICKLTESLGFKCAAIDGYKKSITLNIDDFYSSEAIRIHNNIKAAPHK